MPHSMQGTRGEVRFRNQHPEASPTIRKRIYRRLAQEATLLQLVEEQKKRAARREKAKTTVAPKKSVAEKVKGFVGRIFGRGVR